VSAHTFSLPSADPAAPSAGTSAPLPDISVVIPIFNEADNIERLHQRVAATLAQFGRSYEVWYVDDGSGDGSLELLS